MLANDLHLSVYFNRQVLGVIDVDDVLCVGPWPKSEKLNAELENIHDLRSTMSRRRVQEVKHLKRVKRIMEGGTGWKADPKQLDKLKDYDWDGEIQNRPNSHHASWEGEWWEGSDPERSRRGRRCIAALDC